MPKKKEKEEPKVWNCQKCGKVLEMTKLMELYEGSENAECFVTIKEVV